MKINAKKILAAIAVISLSASVFSGCAANKQKDEPSTGENKISVGYATETTVPEPEKPSDGTLSPEEEQSVKNDILDMLDEIKDIDA